MTVPTNNPPNSKKNKKKHVGFSKEAISKASVDQKKQKTSTVAQPHLTTMPAGLSKGQLTALIMLSLGMSRVLKLASASGASVVGGPTTGGSAESDDGAAVMNEVCVQHLGIDACSDARVQALLRWKYYSAIQCTITVAAVLLQCWSSENLLLMFDAALVLSPVATIVAALVASGSNGILDGRMQNAIMALVLTVLAAPTSLDTIPFRDYYGGRRKRYNYKSLQTLCLLTLSIFSLYEGVVQILLPMVLPPHYRHRTMQQPILLERLLHNTDEESFRDVQPAVNAILNFCVVDKITLALMYVFAWYYFQTDKQRTLLLTVALAKLTEYYYSLPLLNHDFRVDDGLDMITLTTACACALAWIAPNIKWKKSITKKE